MGGKPQPAEVIFRVISADSPVVEDDESQGEKKQNNLSSYHALIYAPPDLLPAADGLIIPEDQPAEVQGLPLALNEEVVVNWTYYRAYLLSFLRGEKAAAKNLSRDKIFSKVSPSLSSLLSGTSISARPLRVWLNLVNPKLVELPWELLAQTGDGEAGSEISLVRGLPPEGAVPKIPIGNTLRVAFIHKPDSTPTGLSEALKGLPQITVEDITEPSLEALQRVLQEGYEVVHLVTEGSTSLAYEGYLYMPRPRPADAPPVNAVPWSRRVARLIPILFNKLAEKYLLESLRVPANKFVMNSLRLDKLTPSDISSMQRGRPVAILCLSPPKSTDTDPNRIDGWLLPNIFRAFSCLGSTALPMPNIVAQIGATDEQRMELFWREFYLRLAETLEVEAAMNAGLEAGSPLPFALFLRQQHRNTFERDKPAENVTQLNAELVESRETMERFHALGEQSDAVASLMERYEQHETARQQHLEEKLLPYLQEGE
jgi:hypothetical protein